MIRFLYFIISIQFIALGCTSKREPEKTEATDFYLKLGIADFDKEYEKVKSTFIVSNNPEDDKQFFSNKRTQKYIDSLLVKKFSKKDSLLIIFYPTISTNYDTLKVIWQKSILDDIDTTLYWTGFTKQHEVYIDKNDIKGHLTISYKNDLLGQIELIDDFNYLYITQNSKESISVNYGYRLIYSD